MCVVGSVVRGTDDGKSMGGGREVFAVRVWREEEGWEDSGRVGGSLEKRRIQNDIIVYNLGLLVKVKGSLESQSLCYLLGSCNTKVVSSVEV